MKQIDDLLHILVITYNRAAPLEKTLEQLVSSPFKNCMVSVLDNCSTDETPEVCERFRGRLPALEVIRHPKNVGASPNYLRAIEISRGQYTWVICDDDQFDFTSCEDVIEKLTGGKIDLLHLGILGNYGWTRGMEVQSDNLARDASHYFFVLSFIPNLIFRTELFDSQLLAAGYRNAVNLYPHFPFLVSTATHPYSMYVSANRIVYRGEDHNYLSGLTWYKLWVSSCQLIENRELRRKAIYDKPNVSDRQPLLWLRSVCACIAEEKIGFVPTVSKSTLDLYRGLSIDQLCLAMLLTPLLVAPRALFPFLWKIHRALRTSPAKRPIPEGAPPSKLDSLRL